MKMGKLTVYIAFLVATLISLEQFSGILISEIENKEFYELLNFPIECETGEDINEIEFKEHKILNKDRIKLSNLLSSFVSEDRQHYLNHPVDVILDVITPPPEA